MLNPDEYLELVEAVEGLVDLAQRFKEQFLKHGWSEASSESAALEMVFHITSGEESPEE